MNGIFFKITKSPIPPPSTAISGSKIFLRNDKGEILFIEDKNINLHKLLMIPGKIFNLFFRWRSRTK
jgi:hypothetical protein